VSGETPVAASAGGKSAASSPTPAAEDPTRPAKAPKTPKPAPAPSVKPPEPPARLPPAVPAASSGSSLSWPVRTILVLAAVLSVAAIMAVWANRQLLDTPSWTHTNTKLLENGAIQKQLSAYLTEQLYTNVDLTGEIESGLPKDLKPLAGPAAGGLRTVVEKGIVIALQTPQVQQLWRSANEATHKQFVEVIEDKGTLVRTPGGGKVVLDLQPIVVNLANRFGAPKSAVEKLRGSVGSITILRSKTLKTAQGVARGLRDLAFVLPVLVLLLLALALGLSAGRRSRALTAVGLVGIVAGLAALLIRGIAGGQVVNTLASTEAVRPAARAAWSIGTSLLVEISVATIFIGALVALAGMLAGRSQWATATRRALAPYLRDRPDLTFGVSAVILLIIFVWGPISAAQKLTGILLITVLSLFGVEMLRRQTAAEFPDAHYSADRDGVRRWMTAARGSIGRRGSRMRAGMAGAAAERRRGTAETAVTPVDQLERLAALHTNGSLTDEEFAAAKSRLFSD
jgi:hypothetical protein